MTTNDMGIKIASLLAEDPERRDLRALFISIVDALDLIAKDEERWGLSREFVDAVNVVDRCYANLRDRWNNEEAVRLDLLNHVHEIMQQGK